MTQSQLSERQSLRERNFKTNQKFKKETFYQFFKNKLTQSNSESVRICFSIDVVELGLYGLEAVWISVDERDAIIKREIEKLLLALGFDSGVNNDVSIHDWRVSCHAIITVNQEELERLYQSEKVASIINPEIDRPAVFRSN